MEIILKIVSLKGVLNAFGLFFDSNNSANKMQQFHKFIKR